jgi:hypothetical protein
MRGKARAAYAIPVLVIAVGVGWLLSSLGVVPQVNWVWTLGLGVVGLLTFLVMGFDKVSSVLGPFFLIAGLLSVLRQTGQLSLDTEVPILVIGVGVCSFIALLPAVPKPQWLIPVNPPVHEETPKKLRLG